MAALLYYGSSRDKSRPTKLGSKVSKTNDRADAGTEACTDDLRSQLCLSPIDLTPCPTQSPATVWVDVLKAGFWISVCYLCHLGFWGQGPEH